MSKCGDRLVKAALDAPPAPIVRIPAAIMKAGHYEDATHDFIVPRWHERHGIAPVCPCCGGTDFDQLDRDQDERIKKQICEFAAYWRTGGASVPRCMVRDRSGTCPRPDVCEEAKPGCLRLDAYVSQCGKMPGQKCPKNICPIRLMEWQTEMNSRRHQG
jgi:hypothetical protein